MKHHIFAVSQTGSGHLLTGPERSFAPCQDAYKVLSVPNQEYKAWNSQMECHILAVADGHGNPTRHGSSEFGSKFAVEAAVETMLQLAQAYEESSDPEVFCFFPEKVTKLWQEKVLAHAKTRFPEQDLRKRFKKEAEYLAYENKILTSYGSTLLAVTAIPEKKLLVSAQIGDGEIVFLAKNARDPYPVKLVRGNKRHVYGGNVTDSLCNSDAIQRFELSILDGKADEEAGVWLEKYVVMAATDGISSGALSERKFMEDYCAPRMQAYMDAEDDSARRWVRESIEGEMLEEMPLYSMDDMTVVMLNVECENAVKARPKRLLGKMLQDNPGTAPQKEPQETKDTAPEFCETSSYDKLLTKIMLNGVELRSSADQLEGWYEDEEPYKD